MRRLSLALVFLCAFFLSGCAQLPAVLSALNRSAQGAQYVGSLLDQAKAHSDLYLAKHPNMEAQSALGVAHRDAMAAIAAYDAAVVAADSAESGELADAKAAAIKAYALYRARLKEHGVLDNAAPDGGAEGMGPDPGPLVMPEAEELPL